MYKTSINGKQLYFVGYRFVDDTDIIQSGQPRGPFQVLAARTQAAMKHGKVDYGLHEEHWSHKSHVGT
jgi:hypothetical protein